MDYVQEGRDDRIYAVTQLLRLGVDIGVTADRTKIDPFFLHKIQAITAMETRLQGAPYDVSVLREAKAMGFSDSWVARLWRTEELDVFDFRREHGLFPVYKMIDTCASEFDSYVPYFYSTYEEEMSPGCRKRKKSWFWAPVPFGLDRGWSLITPQSMPS